MIPHRIFDIETRPKSRAELDAIKPDFKPHPACKTAEAMAKSVAEKTADYYEKAALSPFYGSIVCIGLQTHDGEQTFLCGDEKDVLELFWKTWTEYGQQDKFCFWSGSGGSKQFDIDFIITRSRILGVDVPAFVRRGRYYSERIVDLAQEFLLHQSDAYLSLSNAARIMGLITPESGLTVKSKDDEVRGENFWRYYDGIATDEPKEAQRAKALTYLGNDLKLTAAIARRIL